MSAMASHSHGNSTAFFKFVHDNNRVNITAPHYWAFLGQPPVTSQRPIITEIFSIPQHHHGMSKIIHIHFHALFSQTKEGPHYCMCGWEATFIYQRTMAVLWTWSIRVPAHRRFYGCKHYGPTLWRSYFTHTATGIKTYWNCVGARKETCPWHSYRWHNSLGNKAHALRNIAKGYTHNPWSKVRC